MAAVVASDGLARVFINGKAVAEKPVGGQLRFDYRYSAIGFGNAFIGNLSDLRWWSRAATDTEIAARAGQSGIEHMSVP